MLTYTLRRILGMIPTLLVISAVCFAVIKLQPGSFTDQYLEDPRFTRETAAAISRQLGLDQPALVQYGRWLWGVVTRLDFGYSFLQNRPVVSVIGDLLGWTVFLSLITLLFSWLVAVPLGLYTAFNRHGWPASIANFLGYVGLAIPDFLAALLLVALVLQLGGTNVGGLFSPAYIDAPWSWAKVADLLGHLWIPVLALGLEGVAGLMRQMRASTLDVLTQDYIRTARAKGLPQHRVIWRHAVRNAINPLISLAGLSLPSLISGTIIVSIVLSLPTIGPLLYDSLLNKDQYTALTLLMLSAFLLLVGNLLADLALAWADPRVRYA
ncbi:binding-protein-dependent transport systems inner membrane component [Deinococcus phoenicis]|uniref:Binding-protein-dependent transport systems inner membrane component n=1 Tax=Deinococcus phoenicis TaxID=1476583 RepID=A0A016QSU8_9DEIO|nr:ABC transporter permease [Deinococcus phoenicis]EYB69195.1 binding-protein-dependent transport systems inner membrane component [Deinococcus phoenicis]